MYYAIVNRNYNCLKTILNQFPNAANHKITMESNRTSGQGIGSLGKETSTQLPLELAHALGYDDIQSLLLEYGAKKPIYSDKIPQSNISQTKENQSTLEIENVVFSGGGAAGCAYAGVLTALAEEPSFSFDKLKAVAGTSIGAITALIVSLKYTPLEANELLTNLDLNEFKDSKNIIKKAKGFFFDYGIYKGNYLEQFINKLISNKIKTDHPDQITFSDLKALGFLDLSVVAGMCCKVDGENVMREKKLNVSESPNTSVLSAVHASAAAQPYFAGVRMHEIDNDYYLTNKGGFDFVDGGFINNYPIDIFDYINESGYKVINPHTLGFLLLFDSQMNTNSNHSIERNNNKVDHDKSIINSTLFQPQKQKLELQSNFDRTIQINRLGVDTADFNVDNKTKLALVQSGRDAVKKYFANISDKYKFRNDVENVSIETRDKATRYLM